MTAELSGRFVLRIDPRLHAALRAAARQAGLSLNEYCARRLALPAGSLTGPGAEAVRRAASLAGDALVGVVAFGSWARGQQAEMSDVDLMIALADDVEIGRQLYKAWDSAPLRWEEHVVEPHFVHLPAPGARISGLWAEVAVAGVILFERAFAVSKRLVQFREQIAAGRIVRRQIHGQPYWVETGTGPGQEVT